MIFDTILKAAAERPMLALLVDPDKIQENREEAIQRIARSKVDLVLVGGSLVFSSIEDVVLELKQQTRKPVVLFPGLSAHFTPEADAILFLSLLSGRNPDFLIGNQVHAALPILRSGIEVIPTAYLLVDGGRPTSVQYMSNTMPIPANKPEIALATAAAAQLFGFKMIYLEAGSGADCHIPASFIRQIKSQIQLPLMVGGGIRSIESLREVVAAGADIVVVGTAFEQNPELIEQFTNELRGE